MLLAAGAGTRFGGGKLVARLPGSGQPVARAAWETLAAAFERTVVVVRAGDTATAALFVDTSAQVVVCGDAAQGMGHTLAAGVRASNAAAGWLVALGDMPHVRVDTLRALRAALEGGASIVAPAYGGARGHPVGFAAGHRAALEALTGDAGARMLVRDAGDALVTLDVDDPGVLADIDTREDLERSAER